MAIFFFRRREEGLGICRGLRGWGGRAGKFNGLNIEPEEYAGLNRDLGLNDSR